MRTADGSLSVMIREMLTIFDLGALFADPAFYGFGSPRGDGKPVVVIPGLFGNDFYLQPLHHWLCRSGYTPVQSSLDFNAGCLQRISNQILEQINHHTHDRTGPIALIGHSRGGALAWALAGHLQEKVSHLVMLGSPVASLMASVETGQVIPTFAGSIGRTMMRMSSLLRHTLDPDCTYPSCGCPFVSNIMRPLSARTSILSIYGRDDGLVPKEAQITEGATLEVSASHIGLVYSPEVYHALGRFLYAGTIESASAAVSVHH